MTKKKIAAKKTPVIKKKIETENYDKLKKSLISDIVAELKPQLQEHIMNIKNDIQNDMAENRIIQKPPPIMPKTENISPGNNMPNGFSDILNQLKSGDIDMTKISGLIGGMQNQQIPTGPGGQPLDWDKLSDGQIKYMTQQNQNQMITTLLPLLIGNQSQGNPMITEMMNRIFLEKINSSLYMDKMMIGGMIKKFGGEMPPETGLTSPVSTMINKMNANGTQGENRNALQG